MLSCFSIFLFVESLLKNFLLTTHDVIESAIGGMREKIIPLGLLRLTPCGNRSKYKITTAVTKATKIKYLYNMFFSGRGKEIFQGKTPKKAI